MPERSGTPEAGDPVTIVADALYTDGAPEGEAEYRRLGRRSIAGHLLSALHAAGWRIVRPIGVEDENRFNLLNVAEEWTPDA